MSKSVSLKELINPSERQKEFLTAIDKYRYVLYGGAKGGGKSYILRWALIKLLLKWAQRGHSRVRVGLFCEDYPSLKDRQITKIKTEFPAWLGTLGDSSIEGMSFVLNKKFGSGVIALRNLDDPSKYASSEFACAAVDELTKNHREVFDQLRSIIRWPNIDDTVFIAGTNPGEVGHEWVKKLWIDQDLTSEDPSPEELYFVKSLPTDNPHNSKTYIETLNRLPEKLRKAYLEGRWDVFEGQFFSEWDREKHVIAPFQIPPTWIKMRSIDPSGRDGITSCHWYALDHDGRVYVYREYYATGKDSDEHARNIWYLSHKNTDPGYESEEQYRYTIMDTAAWSKVGLPETLQEVYMRIWGELDREHGVSDNGGPLIQSSKERVMGWDAVHRYLRLDDKGEPKIKFFSNCKDIIRTVPTLMHDEYNPLDVDSDGEDHAADELRYLIQTLRDAHVPKPKSPAEQRLEMIRERLNKQNEFDYSYRRN